MLNLYQEIRIILLSGMRPWRKSEFSLRKKTKMLEWKEKSEIRFVYLCKCDRNKFAVLLWNGIDFLRRVIKNDRKTKHSPKAGCPFFSHRRLHRAFHLCALYFIVERSRRPSPSNIWICHRNSDVFSRQCLFYFSLLTSNIILLKKASRAQKSIALQENNSLSLEALIKR